MKFDMHMHSIYSKHKIIGLDSYSKPEDIVKTAISRGLDGVAVTDHNCVKGSLETKKAARKIGKNFIVITASEIRTPNGDVLAYGIQEDINGKIGFMETIDKIRQQGGIAVVAHPFTKAFGFLTKTRWQVDDLKHFDGIEVFNAGVRKGNQTALEVAKKFGKGMSAGSDAHTLRAIGYAGIECENPLKDIKSGNVKIWGRNKSVPVILENYFMKGYKVLGL